MKQQDSLNYQNRKSLNKFTSILIRTMTKVQEYVASILSLIGLYLILVYFSVFEYTSKLSEIISNKENLIWVGIILFVISYLVSPDFWRRIFRNG